MLTNCTYTERVLYQWRRPQATPQAAPPSLDGFTVRRTGDTQTRIRVLIHLEHYPEQYKVSPELSALLDIKEDSRIGVVTALWNYIKVNNLQDKVDRRIIRPDERLRSVRLIDGQDRIKLLTFFVFSCSTSNKLRSNKYLSW